MRDGGGTFVILLLIALVAVILFARSYYKKAELEKVKLADARGTINNLGNEISELKKAHAISAAVKEKEISHKAYLVEGLTKIIEQRKSQFPWLASAFADLYALDFEREAKRLVHKSHPAVRAADVVQEYGKKHRETVRELRTVRYRVEYYEKIFPWIADYVGDDVPDSAVDVSGVEKLDEDDPAKFWLSKADYDRLPTVEKYQRALDNWKRRQKTNWEIGREYERYVGYVYETQGYDVQFSGAIHGFEDMGRDLIARREQELSVIQCKYWSSEKEIREKHIFQLFASALEYGYRFGGLVRDGQYSFVSTSLDAPKIIPVLYTSTKVSEVAHDVAKILNVTIHEHVKISDYPVIKCNISTREAQKIYHLPFDQQYDRVKIKHAGERYVYAVADAEKMGFRRAWKWHPEAS
jgi:Restriction endonuclease